MINGFGDRRSTIELFPYDEPPVRDGIQTRVFPFGTLLTAKLSRMAVAHLCDGSHTLRRTTRSMDGIDMWDMVHHLILTRPLTHQDICFVFAESVAFYVLSAYSYILPAVWHSQPIGLIQISCLVGSICGRKRIITRLYDLLFFAVPFCDVQPTNEKVKKIIIPAHSLIITKLPLSSLLVIGAVGLEPYISLIVCEGILPFELCPMNFLSIAENIGKEAVGTLFARATPTGGIEPPLYTKFAPLTLLQCVFQHLARNELR